MGLSEHVQKYKWREEWERGREGARTGQRETRERKVEREMEVKKKGSKALSGERERKSRSMKDE